ncbi:VOC family protein [Chloroflexota bacterium]
MFKRIDHVEIVPGNLERSLKFYTEILGFKVKKRMETIAWIELNDIEIEMFMVKNPTPVSPDKSQIGYRRIALEVEDVDKAVEYLKTRGVEVEVYQTPGPPETSKRAKIKDPDGISIELTPPE